jgi:hypothetical protein
MQVRFLSGVRTPPKEEIMPAVPNKLIAISDMYVQCSLKIKHLDSHVTAASDNCNNHATSAALLDDGLMMYRCEKHRGWQDILGYLVPVVTELPARIRAHV